MLKETMNSLKGVLYERINNPLWGTYALTWVLCNWQIVLILLKDKSSTLEKIELIKTSYLYVDGGFNWNVVIIPLGISALLLTIIPGVQTLYFIYAEFVKTEGKKRRDKFESKTRLTIEQSNDLRQRLMAIHTSSQDIASFQDNEINSLKDINKSLQNKLDSTESNEDIAVLLDKLTRAESEKSKLSAKLSDIEAQELRNKVQTKFDAVDIEYAFAGIIGNEIGLRGTTHDADIFRNGSVEYISQALVDAIDSIEKRWKKLSLSPDDSKAGEIAAQLEVAISRLQRIADDMSNSEATESNDYHWSIIASLLTIVKSLLVVAERNQKA